ncbi:MAG: pyridoxamine 5'-phosphate oxidase family protein [Oscillospiraceae bacterium]
MESPKMRRKEREVSGLENLTAILDDCGVMHVGFAADNIPYIVPMDFGYRTEEEKLILYFHCAGEGRKLDMLRKNSRVCFEADCGHSIITGDKACGWSAHYRSVMGEGVMELLESPEDKAAGLDAIMAKAGFSGKAEYSEKQLSAVRVLRLTADWVTGKEH